MKKAFIYTALAVAVLLTGTYAVSKVYAQDTGFRGNLSEEEREEHMAERIAEKAELVSQAVEEGKLTERQAQILETMAELRPVGGRGMFGAGKNLTEEEREALREEMRESREGSMLEALNEAGLNVTEEELQELREVREDIGLMGNQHRRGENGGARGTGECINE